MNATESPSLKRAIEYLGAVEVAPGRYAFKAQHGDANFYCVAPTSAMRIGAHDKAYQDFASLPEVIRMPTWWTPERPIIVRGDREYIYALCPSKEGATAGLSGEHGVMRVLTVNLDTGEEVTA